MREDNQVIKGQLLNMIKSNQILTRDKYLVSLLLAKANKSWSPDNQYP